MINAWLGKIYSRHKSSDCHLLLPGKESGGMVIPIIVTIILLGTLAVAVVSLNTSSTFEQVNVNLGQRAYYLAESGFRYAASKFDDGPSLLDDIHAKSFKLDNNEGQFSVFCYPHWFEIKNVLKKKKKKTILETEVSFGEPPDFTEGTPGYLILKDDSKAEKFDYVEYDATNPKILRFIKRSGKWPSGFSAGKIVLLAADAFPQRIDEGDDLILDTGADYFPRRNAKFEVNGQVYKYKCRDGDTLKKIRAVTGTFPLLLSKGDVIKLKEFLLLKSIGSIGSGNFQANREVTYYVPVSLADLNAEDLTNETFFDSKKELKKFKRGTGATGKPKWVKIDGDGALALKIKGKGKDKPGKKKGRDKLGIVGFDYRSKSAPDFAGAKEAAGGLLSYDVQVKIMIDGDADYCVGLMVRMDQSGNGGGSIEGYGFSFIRNSGTIYFKNYDDLKKQLNNKAALIFWVKEKGNANNKRTILAYKLLEEIADNKVVDQDGHLKDWATLLVRVEDKIDDNGKHYNEFRVYIADPGDGTDRRGNDNPFDTIRQASPRGGIDGTLPWPAQDDNEENDYFTLISGWENVGADELVDYKGHSNVIVKDDTFTTDDYFDAKSPEVGLHTIGPSAESTYFDDLAVRFSGSAQQGTTFHVPVQEE